MDNSLKTLASIPTLSCPDPQQPESFLFLQPVSPSRPQITSRRSFRLTCAPADEPAVEAMLRAQGYAFEPDPFFAPARRLTAEPAPLGTSLAAFFGLIYIQDRASMLPPLALNPEPGAAVLDMCASPGAKRDNWRAW